jgi:WD40 repeat protein/serine/threonine protein kinase
MEEYCAALHAGQKPDRQSFLAAHADIAEALTNCLDGLDFVRRAVPQLSEPGGYRASAAADEVQPAAPLGDFQLVREIGRGGMGVVYEAVQISLGRRVALKVLPFAAAMDAKQLQRFKNEAQAAAHLQHPHIVPVHSVGCERGVHFYAMQFIDGHTLAAVIEELRTRTKFQIRNPKSEIQNPKSEIPNPKSEVNPNLESTRDASAACTRRDSATRIGIGSSSLALISSFEFRISGFFRMVASLGVQAAEALEHAHQLGVIHRDIKPANLLVDACGRLWVTDFGLARLGTDAGLTMTGDLLGTIRYMSPEQALGKRVAVDPRTDVYSLGVTLYELLTLEPAYDGKNREEVLRQIAFEEPRPPRRLNQAVPVELETIVLKAMAKNPDERYATAQELAEDLRRFLEDKPIKAKRPSLRQRAAKWARRHKTVVRAAGVVLLLAVVALAVSTVLIWEAKEGLKGALERERQNAYCQRIALAEREWSDNNLDRMQQLLEECPQDLRGWEWHYLQRLKYQTLPPLRHACAVHCAVFSPDGGRIASSDQDGWVKVWDVHTGQELLPAFRAHQDHVRIVTFSPDGKVLATGSSDGTVKTWDAWTGQPLPAGKRHGGAVWGVAFSPDGRYLASGTRDGVEVWDWATGQEMVRLRGPATRVFGIAFSPDGQRLAAAGRAGQAGEGFAVTVWDVRTRNQQLALGPALNNYFVAFSPDGRLLAAGADKTPTVWDSQTGQELLLLRGHTAVVRCNVAFSPDGGRLASGSGDATIKLWDVHTGREVLTLRGHAGGIRSLAFSPDGHRLLSASADGTVRLWDARPSEGEPNHSSLTLAGHAGAVNTVAFHPHDPRLLASAGADGTIRLWDARNGNPLQIGNTQSRDLEGLAFSHDGERLAFGGGRAADRGWTARVWDTTTWQDIPPWPVATEDGVRSVAFSPDGRLLAVGCYSNKPLTIWEAGSGKPLLKLPNPWVTASVAFRPDGRWLAAANFDGTVRVWDVAAGKEVVRPPLQHGAAATSVAFRSDGKRLASGSMDQTVTVWDTSTWEPRLVLSNPTGAVLSVAFSPDGQRLAWGSTDSTVKVWDEASRKIHTLRGHTGWVNDVAFSPNGQQIASASADGTVKIWKGPPVAEPPAREARNQEP